MFPIVKSLVSNWLDEKKTTQSGSLEASSKIDKKNQEVTGNNEEILTNEVTSAEVSEDLKAREGTVQDLNDGIFTIKSGDEEFYVEAADTQFIFIKNDKVLLNGIVQRHEEFGIPGTFEVKSMQPASSCQEFGRVTKVHDDFIVFEAKILLIKSTVPTFSTQLEVHQECQYEMIESDQKVGGETFHWRIVKVLKVVNVLVPKLLNVEVIEKQVEMFDLSVKIPFNTTTKCTKKFLFMRNNSSEKVMLQKCSINPPKPEIIKLLKDSCDVDKVLYHLMPKDKKGFRLFFQITPQVLGNFHVEVFAEFMSSKNEKFSRTAKINIEVYGESNFLTGQRNKNIPRFTEIRFKEYLVPSNLREFDFTKTKEVVENLSKKFKFLEVSEVTPLNYIDKLSHAIYLEEIAMEIAFKSYHIPKARFEDSDNFLKLEVKDVAEKRPSIIMGDAVEASDPYRDEKDQIVYKGFIHKVENDAVLLKFHEDFHVNHRGKEYTVNFCFSRSSYRQQHHAIETVTNGLGYQFLFPRNIPSRHLQVYVELKGEKLISLFGGSRREQQLQWFDNKLNKYQKAAVVNALRGECRPMPYIIYGPAGTGKTLTVIELIKQIFTLDRSFNIIVATPSNSAANLFTDALIASGSFKNPLDFVRLVSNNQVEKCLIPDYLKRYCATVSVASRNKNQTEENLETDSSGMRKNLTKHDISNYRICIGTLSCFGNLMQMKFPDDHFSHVIIDEAGQSTEAETLIPISLLAQFKGQVILAGDPLQLGPISNSRHVKNMNLDFSLLERLLTTNECYAQNSAKEYDPRFVTKLKINYRSLPSILKIYNDLFYNSELEGAIDSENSSEAELFSMILEIDNLFPKATGRSCGAFFVDVAKGKNRRVPDSCSWYNEEEINSIISFLSKLNAMGIEFKEIGIITPYALQVKKFKHKIAFALPDTDLKVGTVEEFQGEERAIILVSTVRTDERHFRTDVKFGLGFLQCNKRMNVAISRAQSMLVVFGKGEVLKKHEKWVKLIAYTEENSTFITDDRT